MATCDRCDAKCCKYFVLQIDTPTTRNDYEHIRWYLAHKNSAVFIHRKEWFLEVISPCRYLQRDNTCGIYEKRPDICRKHSDKTCELHDSHFGHDDYFRSLEAFDRYLDEWVGYRKK